MRNQRFNLMVKVEGQSTPLPFIYTSAADRARAAYPLHLGGFLERPGYKKVKPLALGLVDQTDVFTAGFDGELLALEPRPASFPPPSDGVLYRLAVYFQNGLATIESFTTPAERYSRAEAVAKQPNMLPHGKVVRLTLLDLMTLPITNNPTNRASEATRLLAALSREPAPSSRRVARRSQLALVAGVSATPSATNTRSPPPLEVEIRDSADDTRSISPLAVEVGEPAADRPNQVSVGSCPCTLMIELPIYRACELQALVTGKAMVEIINGALEDYIAQFAIDDSSLHRVRDAFKHNLSEHLAAYQAIIAKQIPGETERRAIRALTKHRPTAEMTSYQTEIEQRLLMASRLLAKVARARTHIVINNALQTYICAHRIVDQDLVMHHIVQAPNERREAEWQNLVSAYKAIVLAEESISRSLPRALRRTVARQTPPDSSRASPAVALIESTLEPVRLVPEEGGTGFVQAELACKAGTPARKGGRIKRSGWIRRPPAPMRKCLIDVEIPIHEAWKGLVAQTKMSMSTIVNCALEQYIQTLSGKGKAAQVAGAGDGDGADRESVPDAVVETAQVAEAGNGAGADRNETADTVVEAALVAEEGDGAACDETSNAVVDETTQEENEPSNSTTLPVADQDDAGTSRHRTRLGWRARQLPKVTKYRRRKR